MAASAKLNALHVVAAALVVVVVVVEIVAGIVVAAVAVAGRQCGRGWLCGSFSL